MKVLLAPSKRLYLLAKGHGQRRLVQLPIKLVDSFAVKGDTLVVVTHKTLTVYSQQPEGQIVAGPLKFASTFQTTLSKKIEAVVFQPSGLYLSDKYGDVFSIEKGQRTFLNQNFAIPRFIHWVIGPARDYLVIADEYSKLKIFNASNLHELLSVWVPFSAQPVQLLTLGKRLIYLARRISKENTSSAFELYELESSQLELEEFPNKRIPYQSEMNNDNIECRLVSTGEHSFAVVCLHPELLSVDCYSSEEAGVTHQSKRTHALPKADRDSLSVVYTEEDRQLLVLLGQESELDPPTELSLESESLELTAKETLLRISLA